jgi:hypothetical protein
VKSRKGDGVGLVELGIRKGDSQPEPGQKLVPALWVQGQLAKGKEKNQAKSIKITHLRASLLGFSDHK